MFFFLLTSQNVLAQKIRRFSEILRTRTRPIGIGRPICPGLMLAAEKTRKVGKKQCVYI